MVRIKLGLFILISCLLAPLSALSQEVTATVDRAELIRGENLTFSIRIEDLQNISQPDLSELLESFDIVGSSRSNRSRFVNGRSSSWTEYNLTLVPKSTGELTIPAIEFGAYSTDPIAVTVHRPGAVETDGEREVFLETTLNKNEVYVQEQVLFTMRLLYTIEGIRNPQFTPLDIDNAVVELIGSPNQYEKLIDGVRHGVYERQYVIFPQQSGTLEIPDIAFQGQLSQGASPNIFHDPPTRPITAFTEGHTIDVREKPATFSGDTWLPARDLTITESWSDDIHDLEIGDEITRTITIVADGLDGAVLPPLERTRLEQMNFYPEPPQIERTFVNGSIVGTRTEAFTIVATESGELDIPAIEIPWWDIEANEESTALLPSTQIRIGGDGVAPPAQLNEEQADSAQRNALNGSDAIDYELTGSPATPAWIIAVAAVLAVVLMLIVYRLNLYRAALAHERSSGDHASVYRREPDTEQERAAFRELSRISKQDDLHLTRIALIKWGRHYFRDADLHNLDDLADRTRDSRVKAECIALQAALYGRHNDSSDGGFDAGSLVEHLAALRSRDARQRSDDKKRAAYELRPLYRS